MKKNLLIVVCLLCSYSYINAQNSGYELLTYKTKTEEPGGETLLEKLFGSKNTKPKAPEMRTVSAKILVKGKASLYEVDDYPGKYDLNYGTKPFYFIKTDEGTFPLLHREQGNTYTVTQPYKGMLRYVLRYWDARDRYINSANYTDEGLIRIIEEYNNLMK